MTLPWELEYKQWINSSLEQSNGVYFVKWWGHGQQFGTTWISLACQGYLSIMGASTSNEQAFSVGGLIITKLRNQLCGNLVEALQVTKVTLRQELIVQEPALPVQLEEKLDQDDAEESGNMFGINTGGEQEIYVRGKKPGPKPEPKPGAAWPNLRALGPAWAQTSLSVLMLMPRNFCQLSSPSFLKLDPLVITQMSQRGLRQRIGNVEQQSGDARQPSRDAR
ncbi:hypothetical protein D9757_008457 [Collybiopsis confluens]|uniref:HAT C-terminal dimerisation domain-containing protein n=1 Tax=Collybiopsis confluens TaxID=2823264 RepID=A0A8H5HF91_9AGAR|nr:hypothetical protein D9757_008457 [Collybiopsis confluens]